VSGETWGRVQLRGQGGMREPVAAAGGKGRTQDLKLRTGAVIPSSKGDRSLVKVCTETLEALAMIS
jgi:hypothetical protein